MLARAAGAGMSAKREATIVGLWVGLVKTNAAALVEVPPVTRHALAFRLVHGCSEPPAEPGYRDAVVVVRNDDYTTMEFVQSLLREVFGLSEARAKELMMAVHEGGRAAVGRYPGPEAIQKVEQARSRAKRDGHPMWIGIEPG